jgi:hypothetical protein
MRKFVVLGFFEFKTKRFHCYLEEAQKEIKNELRKLKGLKIINMTVVPSIEVFQDEKIYH